MSKVGTFLEQLEQLRRLPTAPAEAQLRGQTWLRSYEEGIPHSSPPYGYLKVVRSCNSRCVYCDHWTLPSDRDPTTAELLSAIAALHDLGVQHINLTGGEPLLRQDLPELIACAHHYGMVVCLLTNGLLLPSKADALLSAELDAAILSLDSVVPSEFKHTRGISLTPVEAGLQTLLAMRARRPAMFISITCVVTQVNLQSLRSLVEYADRFGVGVQFSPYHHFDVDQADELTPRDKSALERAVRQLLEMKSHGYQLLDSPAYLDHFARFFPARTLPANYRCLAGYIAVFIDTDLNVRPCWMMKPVGNLRQESLFTIWHSARFQEARQQIRVLNCPRCWLLCTAEPSFHAQDTPDG